MWKNENFHLELHLMHRSGNLSHTSPADWRVKPPNKQLNITCFQNNLIVNFQTGNRIKSPNKSWDPGSFKISPIQMSAEARESIVHTYPLCKVNKYLSMYVHLSLHSSNECSIENTQNSWKTKSTSLHEPKFSKIAAKKSKSLRVRISDRKKLLIKRKILFPSNKKKTTTPAHRHAGGHEAGGDGGDSDGGGKILRQLRERGSHGQGQHGQEIRRPVQRGDRGGLQLQRHLPAAVVLAHVHERQRSRRHLAHRRQFRLDRVLCYVARE